MEILYSNTFASMLARSNKADREEIERIAIVNYLQADMRQRKQMPWMNLYILRRALDTQVRSEMNLDDESYHLAVMQHYRSLSTNVQPPRVNPSRFFAVFKGFLDDFRDITVKEGKWVAVDSAVIRTNKGTFIEGLSELFFRDSKRVIGLYPVLSYYSFAMLGAAIEGPPELLYREMEGDDVLLCVFDMLAEYGLCSEVAFDCLMLWLFICKNLGEKSLVVTTYTEIRSLFWLVPES